MTEKKLTIVVAGFGLPRAEECVLRPNSTAREILAFLGLRGRYVLAKADGTQFQPEDNVYDRVSAGERLNATLVLCRSLCHLCAEKCDRLGWGKTTGSRAPQFP